MLEELLEEDFLEELLEELLLEELLEELPLSPDELDEPIPKSADVMDALPLVSVKSLLLNELMGAVTVMVERVSLCFTMVADEPTSSVHP